MATNPTNCSPFPRCLCPLSSIGKCWPYNYSLPNKFDLNLSFNVLPALPLGCTPGQTIFNYIRVEQDALGNYICDGAELLESAFPDTTPLFDSFNMTLTMQRVQPPAGQGIGALWVQKEAGYYGGSLGATSIFGLGLDNQGYAALPVPYPALSLPTAGCLSGCFCGVGSYTAATGVPFTTFQYAFGLAAALFIPTAFDTGQVGALGDGFGCPLTLLLFLANIDAGTQQLTDFSLRNLETFKLKYNNWAGNPGDESVSVYGCLGGLTPFVFPTAFTPFTWVGKRMTLVSNGSSSIAGGGVNYCESYQPFQPTPFACGAPSGDGSTNYSLGCGFTVDFQPQPCNAIAPFELTSVSIALDAVIQNANLKPGVAPFGPSPGSCCSICPDFSDTYTLTIVSDCPGLSGSYPLTWSGSNTHPDPTLGTDIPGPQWGWAGFIQGWAAYFNLTLICAYLTPTGTQVPTQAYLENSLTANVIANGVVCDPLTASGSFTYSTPGGGATYTVNFTVS